MAVPGNPSARLTHHLKLITGQRFLRFSILKETPMAPIFVTGRAQKSMLVEELNLMGLPGETMRRKVPFKGRWSKLVAAWKTTSPWGWSDLGNRSLIGGRLLSLVVALGLLLMVPSCGKKAPPFLAQKNFDGKVSSLNAEVREGYIFLKGNVLNAQGGAGNLAGCRVYFAQYSPDDAPCDGCPIEYQGYHSFGPEVVKDGKFFCKIDEITPGQVYFFRVSLVGPKEVLGPPSNDVRVEVR
jgi:hypothetical protein